MRNCLDCGAAYEPTGNAGRCLPCRRISDKAWRDRRKAEGRPVPHSPNQPGYNTVASRAYYAKPENKQRRAERIHAYRQRDDVRAKDEARRLLRNALRRGDLARAPCEKCGAAPAHAHHDNYGKPLDVRWLCAKHHYEHHKSE